MMNTRVLFVGGPQDGTRDIISGTPETLKFQTRTMDSVEPSAVGYSHKTETYTLAHTVVKPGVVRLCIYMHETLAKHDWLFWMVDGYKGIEDGQGIWK